MADREPEQVTSTGLAPTAHAASAGGDTVPPNCTLRVINGDAASHTLTMVTPGLVDGDLAVDNRDVVIPASDFRFVRVKRDPYVNSDGRVDLTWDATTGMTFEVIRP